MRAFHRAGSEPFDLAIIGGGIVGTGIARDAARRGLSVALFERDDFGAGTTAASTRLVHGGLRYLATGDLRLVRLDMRERETLLRIAPHLVTPLPFVLPFERRRAWEQLRLRAGMLLYDALSYDKSLPAHRVLDANERGRLEPGLDAKRFSGAAVYFDAQVFSPERLALENVLDAVAYGALAVNHAEVTHPLRDGARLAGVKVRDRLTGDQRTVFARVIVNAAGPWLDRAAASIEASRPNRLRTTKGVHVACDRVTEHAIALESAVDGRLVFAIPWAGYTWLGTTDTDFSGDPADAVATAEDVDYLIDSVSPAIPAVRHARRHWACAGVRALVGASGSASDVTRMHRVVSDVPGLISVIGGKITGYRAIAEEVTDLVCRELQMEGAPVTTQEPLPGAGPHRSGVEHLDRIYGSRATLVQALAAAEPSLRAPIAPGHPDIAAQVAFAVRQEWCARLEDFMLRRSYIGFAPDRGVSAAEPVSYHLQRELRWPEEQRRHEVRRYNARVERDLLPARGALSAHKGDHDTDDASSLVEMRRSI
jgi:glycerol-3-phosphate dehydrogenase